MNIVLVAEESAGVQALRMVSASPHRLVAVLTGSGDDGRGATVASNAAQHDVTVLPAERVKDPALADELGDLDTDVLLNVHSLYLVHADVLAAARVGAFNLHPGPLPEFAGLSVPSWAIYEGRDRHAVTLHWMKPGIDTGDVVSTADFPVTETDTGLTVSARCVELGMPLVSELLDQLAAGSEIPRHAQPLEDRRYFRRAGPHDGRVPWQLPARRVIDFVRASDYGPFPSPWGVPQTGCAAGAVDIIRLGGTGESTDQPPGTVRITDSGAMVATADEWVRVVRIRQRGRSAEAASTLRDGEVLADPPPADRADT